MTSPTDDLDERIAALLAEREAKAQREAEEAEQASETARRADLWEWRRSRMSTEQRILQDQTDLRELEARFDRMKAEAIDAFWKARADG